MATGLGDEKLWLCPTLDNVTPFNDLSDQGNNGTAQGGLSTVADTGSGGAYCYDLNGTTQYITLGNVLTGTGDFTISGWFNTDSTSFSYIYGKDVEGPGSDGIGIAQQSNAVYGAIGSGLGRTVLAAAGTTTISTWYHYAVTFDRDGVATKYLDGVQVGTDSISSKSGDIGTDTDYVGRYGSASQGFFDGKLDDIRAYNRALTQSEISWLATERGVLGTPPEGLGDEQLWLCPSIQDSANDISGNGNNGTLVGGTAIVSDTGSGGTKSFESYTTATDRVDIPSGVLSDSSDVSLSVWVKNKQTSAGSSIRNIVRTTNDDLFIYANQTRYRGGAGGVYVQDTLANLNTTEYYHYALNYTQATGTVELFRDGVSIGTTSGATAITVSGAMDLLKTSLAFVDDVRAYNRVLTQAEISWLATERGVLGTPPEGLGDEYGWWCPSLDANADGLTNLAGGADAALKLAGQFGVVSDTGSGGTKAWEGTGVGNSGINTGVVPLVDNDFSMSCWFKQDLGAGGYQEIMAVEDPSTRDYLQCRVSNGAMSTDFNGLTMSEPTDLRGGWHHVVVTLDYSGNAASQYIDGVLVNSGTMSNGWSQNLGEWEIGSQGRSGTLVWDGLLDDSRIYNRVLTQAEITHLASQRGVLGSPATTTQYNAFLTHAFRQLFQTRLR